MTERPAASRRPRLATGAGLAAAVFAAALGGLVIYSASSDPSEAVTRAEDLLNVNSPQAPAAVAGVLRRFGPSPELLRTQGFLAEQSGQAARAERLFVLADRASRRDAATQAWLLDHRLKTGDYERAFDHADAQLRRRIELGPEVFPKLATAMDNPTGLAALTRKLKPGAPWRRDFLIYLSVNRSPQVAETLLLRLKAAGAAVEPEEIAIVLSGYVGQLHHAEAGLAYARLTGDAQFVPDGNFEGRSGVAPFNWTWIGGVGVSNEIAPTGDAKGGKALHIRYDGYSRTRIGYHYVALPLGRGYRLTGKVKSATPDALDRLRWALICYDTGVELAVVALPKSTTWKVFSADFQLAADACSGQLLELKTAPGSRRRDVDVWIDDIRIEPVAAR